MQVREVMSHPVHIAKLTTHSRDAARLMRDEHVGALHGGVGGGQRSRSWHGDGSRHRRPGRCRKSPAEQCGGEHRHVGRVYYCFDDDSLDEAARIMAQHQVRRLPVPNRGHRLVGIAALGDLARSLGLQLPGLSRKSIKQSERPPGQHGAGTVSRRKSDFGKQLMEKQKLRMNYSLTERQLRDVVAEARRSKTATGPKIVELHERRLDNFRAGLAPTIPGARRSSGTGMCG